MFETFSGKGLYRVARSEFAIVGDTVILAILARRFDLVWKTVISQESKLRPLFVPSTT